MLVRATCRALATAGLAITIGVLSSVFGGVISVRAQEIHSASGPTPPTPFLPDDSTAFFHSPFGEGANGDANVSDEAILINRLYLVPRLLEPPEGLIIEMSLAPPENIPASYYDLAKYGRVAVDYTRVGMLDGANLGLAAQALHVAHHLLFYSAGLSSDINNDGMFILTAGLAHYQTGNSRSEPFVDAPFIRFRFQSSPDYVFLYSEIETTMHFRQYISGMAGLGLRVSPAVRLMGGFHHTEFVMPTEQVVQMINGLEGIISWGM